MNESTSSMNELSIDLFSIILPIQMVLEKRGLLYFIGSMPVGCKKRK